MNIALSALILTILLLPGAVSLIAYYTSLRERESAGIHIAFSELLLKGIVISLVIHCSTLCIIGLFDYIANFELLYTILIGKEVSITRNEFSSFVLQFGTYIISLSGASFILTKFFKRFVLKHNLDIKFSILKTFNYWYLVFSGRLLDNRKSGKRDQTDLIYIDILAKKDIVYSGFLLDYTYSPHKDILQSIVLKTAAKRFYFKDTTHHLKLSEPSYIPGDAFIIPGEDIVNINIYYVKVDGEATSGVFDVEILNGKTINETTEKLNEK